MSRRHRLSGFVRGPEVATIAPGPELVVAAPAIERAPAVVETLCQRAITQDSLRWHCACGAGGPVGRSSDGIPFVTEEMLRHLPGQQKES